MFLALQGYGLPFWEPPTLSQNSKHYDWVSNIVIEGYTKEQKDEEKHLSKAQLNLRFKPEENAKVNSM